MALSPQTTSEEFKNAKLFLSITQRNSCEGDIQYYFTFHEAFEMEARSVVCNLGLFLRDELGLDPDMYCFPASTNPSHTWDPKSRTCINPTGALVADLVGCTIDIKEVVESQAVERDPDEDMNSKEGREFQRTVGVDDTETVNDMTTKKQSWKKVPQQIVEDGKSVSEMSGLTNYSSETKASLHRKELRNTVSNQQVELDEKEDEIQRLKALLLQQQDKNTTQTQDTKDGQMEETPPKPELDDGMSYSDTPYAPDTSDKASTTSYDSALFHPSAPSSDTYNVHGMYVYPERTQVHSYLLEDDQVPYYHVDIATEFFIDPHWRILRSRTFEKMSFLARRKRIEGWAVFVLNLQQEAEDESSVYVWDILGAKYAVYGTSKYENLVPEEIGHHLYKKVKRTQVRYPVLPEDESQMRFLDDKYGSTPIHNPSRLKDHPLDHHWVKLFEGDFEASSHREHEYRDSGYFTLASATGASEQKFAIYFYG